MLKIEMHFLPDIFVPCEVCKGRRYNRETLEVRYKGKNIADVLEMTVDEAVEFFAPLPRIRNKLQTLCDEMCIRDSLHPADQNVAGGAGPHPAPAAGGHRLGRRAAHRDV